MTAQTTLGQAETANEQDFARNKAKAEADYANQVNSFVQGEYDRLQESFKDTRTLTLVLRMVKPLLEASRQQ